MNKRHVIAVLSAAAALGSSVALAHHGFTGEYDSSTPLWIEGTVTKVTFSPPHPTMVIRLQRDARPTPPSPLPPEANKAPALLADRATAEVEFPPIGTFYALGEKVKIGDKVSLIALRNCKPPHQLRSQWIRIASQEVVTRDGRMSYMVARCP
jgi:hypothetical protein